MKKVILSRSIRKVAVVVNSWHDFLTGFFVRQEIAARSVH